MEREIVINDEPLHETAYARMRSIEVLRISYGGNFVLVTRGAQVKFEFFQQTPPTRVFRALVDRKTMQSKRRHGALVPTSLSCVLLALRSLSGFWCRASCALEIFAGVADFKFQNAA